MMLDYLITISIVCAFFVFMWYICKDIFYTIWDYCNIKNIIYKFNKEGKRFYKSMNGFIYFLNKCHFALIEDDIEEYEINLQDFYNRITLIKNRFDKLLKKINEYNRFDLMDSINDYSIILKFDNLVNKTTIVKDIKQCIDDFKSISDEFGEMINKICS